VITLLAVPVLLTAAILGPFPLFPLFALLAMLGVWLGGIVHFRPAGPRPNATDVLTPGTVRLASEARSLTPLEKAYLALLQALLSSSPSLGEATVRGILPPLNELLQNARDLDTQQQCLLLPVGDTTIASLVQQRDDLARRVEQSTDAVARQTMQQSLELCEARLEDLRQLESHVARLDAQRELISQMFASLQSSLARLQATPASLAAPDVDELRRSVVHLSQQARAVEQAIQEVTTLRQV